MNAWKGSSLKATAECRALDSFECIFMSRLREVGAEEAGVLDGVCCLLFSEAGFGLCAVLCTPNFWAVSNTFSHCSHGKSCFFGVFDGYKEGFFERGV